MSSARILAALAAILLSAAPANAASLLAIGALTGSAAGPDTDLSGLSGKLENGVPANILGGIGSALAWAGGDSFIAVPDRGPNAARYNKAVDDTVSFIARLQHVTLRLRPEPSGGLPMTLDASLTATTLLHSRTKLAYGSGAPAGLPPGDAVNGGGRFYFTGRSDNFAAGASGSPDNARLDPEGARVAADGRSVFVSDEYGPYVYQFDRATGERLRAYALPAQYYAARPAATRDAEKTANAAGRTPNQGMEGLAISPDGGTLFGIMQSALLQDAGPAPALARIVAIDVASGAVREYAYRLTTGTGVSEIVAVNDHVFLVDERDGRGLGDNKPAVHKHIYRIDLQGAREIGGLPPAEALAHAVPKAEFADLVALLGKHGIGPDAVPSKIEGMAVGRDVTVAGAVQHTLWISVDNDFVPAESGPNRLYVLGFTDADLGGATLVPQTLP